MEQLATFIKATGRTRSQFAEQVGISAPYLSQIISGQRRPSIDVALRIANATGNAVTIEMWAKHEAPLSGSSATPRSAS